MANALPLLMVPGMLCSPRLFEPQLEALGEGRDIIIADNVSHNSMADFAEAALGAAPERFALAGLSMGGYIAFEIMRKAPERVDRLALLNTRAVGDEPGELEGRRALLATANAKGVDEAIELLLPRLVHLDRIEDEPLIKTVKTMAEEVGVDAFNRQMEAVINRPNFIEHIGDISCPTAVIVGDRDALTPLHFSRAIATGIPGAKLHVIPGCGHLSTVERPQQVNAVLRGWLDA